MRVESTHTPECARIHILYRPSMWPAWSDPDTIFLFTLLYMPCICSSHHHLISFFWVSKHLSNVAPTQRTFYLCNLYTPECEQLVCVYVCICVEEDLAGMCVCVFVCNSQRWRKRQKINMGRMGSIVIPTSCHSQLLFTAQQWQGTACADTRARERVIHFIFSADICVCIWRDSGKDFIQIS